MTRGSKGCGIAADIEGVPISTTVGLSRSAYTRRGTPTRNLAAQNLSLRVGLPGLPERQRAVSQPRSTRQARQAMSRHTGQGPDAAEHPLCSKVWRQKAMCWSLGCALYSAITCPRPDASLLFLAATSLSVTPFRLRRTPSGCPGMPCRLLASLGPAGTYNAWRQLPSSSLGSNSWSALPFWPDPSAIPQLRRLPCPRASR